MTQKNVQMQDADDRNSQADIYQLCMSHNLGYCFEIPMNMKTSIFLFYILYSVHDLDDGAHYGH